jgi:hypothetical protein
MSITIKNKQKDTDWGKFTLNLTKEEERQTPLGFCVTSRISTQIKEKCLIW